MDFKGPIEPANDLMMEDVFTTGGDEEDMEDIGKHNDELVAKKPLKPAKIAASNYRPKKVSSRVKGMPEIVSDSFEEMEEPEHDQPGPSNPRKIKELRTVQETTRDDEGFLVTNTSKKMVETDETSAPPPTKKAKVAAPAPSKKAKGVPKQQSTLTSFFKKL
jgi:hypothetical protein